MAHDAIYLFPYRDVAGKGHHGPAIFGQLAVGTGQRLRVSRTDRHAGSFSEKFVCDEKTESARPARHEYRAAVEIPFPTVSKQGAAQ
jgi:hypothetical protein